MTLSSVIPDRLRSGTEAGPGPWRATRAGGGHVRRAALPPGWPPRTSACAGPLWYMARRSPYSPRWQPAAWSSAGTPPPRRPI
jgi:hypothetical protein